ncbi:helix-turn-helix domain-containing protein [Pelosinus baikalensis]|uniref:Helix-turn-helix domain-containing protein n=1 Tax=Pelosinus baikalensis TaxID=2892015 RepID=A0ABS8HR06_9FIRM|nr:AraC family transcriptional regulator [Pelosinus baikalensis]MCC5464693.1 helix-turn-helix domain-containing protein [Pelosinus baikalensis]
MDIALSVGFNNQNYYNVMFKKFMNYTPLEFRNQRKSS